MKWVIWRLNNIGDFRHQLHIRWIKLSISGPDLKKNIANFVNNSNMQGNGLHLLYKLYLLFCRDKVV